MARYRPSQAAERRRPKHYVEYALLRALIALLAILPRWLVRWKARRLGDLAFSIVRIRRQTTLENLHLAFGEGMNEPERRQLARDVYRSMATTFLEFAYDAGRGGRDLGDRWTARGFEHVEAAAASGRGILLLTGHVGNWELLGSFVGQLEQPVHVVAGDQKNLLVDRYVRRLRRQLGMRIITMGTALKDVIRILRRGGRVALVADQDGGPDGIFVNYMGRPASCAVGPARFAYRTGSPVIIGLSRRLRTGRYEATFYPPILPDPERPEREEIERILIAYTRTLEDFVRRYPDQWFWMHRRWKTERSSCGG